MNIYIHMYIYTYICIYNVYMEVREHLSHAEMQIRRLDSALGETGVCVCVCVCVCVIYLHRL